MHSKRISKQVAAGNIKIGGGADISIQSMLSVSSDDIAACVQQARALAAAGCEIIRVALPERENAARLVCALKDAVSAPIVADIHFDWRIALEAVAAGVDKVRINPGNIGDDARVRQVALACREKCVPIRIGVNSGSVEKHILAKHGRATPAGMAESALYHAALLEKNDFSDIVLSVKSSAVPDMLACYRLIAQQCDYPLHLGLTHAGGGDMALIKSALGIGGLLLEGIGDTVRVSLTGDPLAEVYAARDILRAVGLRSGPSVIACPTCGRCKADVAAFAKQVEQRLQGCETSITVAVMGCVVNGPGEAREADVGLCFGDGSAALFAKGALVAPKIDTDRALDALFDYIDHRMGE